MAFIHTYKEHQIWQSDRHGKACVGAKQTTSIQVRDYSISVHASFLGKSGGNYLLLKQFSYPMHDMTKRAKAIEKAKAFIDQITTPAVDTLMKP